MSKRGNNEGSIYKLPDGRWRAAVSLGWKAGHEGEPVWKRKVITKATRGEVQEELTRVLRRKQMGIAPGPEKETVETFLTSWLRDVVQPSTRPKTYRSYEQMVRVHLIPALGKKRLAKLTIGEVQSFMSEWLNRGHSPSLVRYVRSVLRIALNEALRKELVARNVAALAKPPRVAKAEFETFTPDQARLFLAAASGHRLEALFTVALAIGLRHGEALALLDSDLNLTTGTLRVFHTLQRLDGTLQRVETKSEKGRRMVPLPRICVEVLGQHLLRRQEERLLAGSNWQDTGYLFTSTRGTPLLERNVLRSFHALLEQAKLPKMRMHDLRHACVSLLAAQGVDLKTIAEIVGHPDVRLTQAVYQHTYSEAKRSAVEKLGDSLSPVATKVATKSWISKPN